MNYHFGQVSIDKPKIGYAGNCGNISSAVGPYAIDEGLVKAEEPIGKTQGKIIVDFAMDGIGLLSRPIQLDVVDGRVSSIRGGREAEELKKLLEVDENALNIAEFAIGTNPKSRMKGNMAEDKILSGCVHVAVGDNHTIGGRLRSNVHLDGVILNPTVEIDSHFIAKKGILLPID